MKKKIMYFFKYNKIAYLIYYYVIGFGINILKIFIPTDNHLILFNSFGGKKYDDSPRVLFEAMRNDPRFKRYRFVWAFHDPENFVVEGAEKIKTDNFLYFRTALAAKVWISNSSIERGLSFKKKHTLYLNTSHGTPLKLAGSDLSNDNQSFKKIDNSIDVFCTQGKYDSDIFSRIFNIPKGRILESGLPRNDILANYSSQQRDRIRSELEIKENQIVVLYCPTFREYGKDKKYNIVLAPPINLNKWEAQLGEKYVLFFRAHYEVSKMMNIEENDFVRDMTNYPFLNDLMIASDILLSDYSSVYFDYSIMGKPMLHFCYDYNEYASKRGMYFDIRKWIDGADNEDEIIEYIKNIKNTSVYLAEKTRKFRNNYVKQYGDATEQCINCIASKVK